MEPVKLSNDQKLITVTEDHYVDLIRNLEMAKDELARKRFSVEIDWRIDHSGLRFLKRDTAYFPKSIVKVYVQQGDDIMLALGNQLQPIKNFLDEAAFMNNQAHHNLKKVMKELQDLEMAVSIKERAVEKQKLLPRWVLKLFGIK